MHYSGILLFLAVILVFCPTVHCHKKNQAHFNPKTTLQYINYQFPQPNNNCLNSSVVELPTLDWEVVGSIPGWGKSFNLLITSIFVEDSIGQSIWSNLQVLSYLQNYSCPQNPFQSPKSLSSLQNHSVSCKMNLDDDKGKYGKAVFRREKNSEYIAV